jgi:hypothetical protein
MGGNTAIGITERWNQRRETSFMELKKLMLSKETVKVLSDEALARVGGGAATYNPCIPIESDSCAGTCSCGTANCGSANPPCYN